MALETEVKITLAPRGWDLDKKHLKDPIHQPSLGMNKNTSSQLSWKLRDAIASIQTRNSKKANMANLPPYKLPCQKRQEREKTRSLSAAMTWGLFRKRIAGTVAPVSPRKLAGHLSH